MNPPTSPFRKILLALALLGSMFITPTHAADDDKLSQILIPGEDWQVAAQELSFADGLSTDADGNVYFCEMRAKPPAIFKMTPDGVKTKVGEGSRSGTRRGPDGKLYAVGTNQALVYDLATGASTVLAEKISTNDLIVSAKGFLYLTEPAKNQITLIDSKTKEVKALDRGIKSPNGIGLSPDQKTLYVSDYGTTTVYAFTVQPDGTLTDKKALMMMKAPENKPTIANGDGLTIDTAGRVYVTTAHRFANRSSPPAASCLERPPQAQVRILQPDEHHLRRQGPGLPLHVPRRHDLSKKSAGERGVMQRLRLPNAPSPTFSRPSEFLARDRKRRRAEGLWNSFSGESLSL